MLILFDDTNVWMSYLIYMKCRDGYFTFMDGIVRKCAFRFVMFCLIKNINPLVIYERSDQI